MPKIKVIDKTHISGWRKRWIELSSRRFFNDYQVAELAAEIRKEFPKGASGNLQFSQFIRLNLKGTNGQIMGRKADAFELFTKEEWANLGGWSGLSFLAALTDGERRRVIASLKGDGPHHYGTIRNHALRLRIVSRRKGRDTRSKAEERVQRLQGWILDLYRNKSIKDLLPPMPKEVRAVLTDRSLTGLVERANSIKA